ncbi:MAG: endonuclease III [Candidatus Aenigmatarchaeota archaeon]
MRKENDRQKMRIVLSYLNKKYGNHVDGSILKKRSDLFRLLISTVLSQRALDETTEVVSERLFSKVRMPSDILKMKRSALEQTIRQSGPFRQKAKKIIAISRTLEKDYSNSFPRTREELMALYGVGPKTADIVLSYGYGIPVIAVDVHVDVVSKRLGFAREKAKYEEIRSSLERLVPESGRYIVNLGLVSFGKEICVTRKPKCEICGLKKICAYYNSNKIRISKPKQNQNKK